MNKYLIVLLTLVLMIYILPSFYATYSASHSMESSDHLYCTSCHEYIANEMMLTSNSQEVLDAHTRAANNTNYTTYINIGGISYIPDANESLNGSVSSFAVIYSIDFINNEIGNNSTYDQSDAAYFWNTDGNNTWMLSEWNFALSTFEPTTTFEMFDLDIDNSSSIDIQEVCLFCHSAVFFGLEQKHTSSVVRGCDDDRCHGNKNHMWADARLFGISPCGVLSAGRCLSEEHGKYPVHQIFYNDLSKIDGYYQNALRFGIADGNTIENGTKLSAGYWTCMGCHTNTKFNITVIEPDQYMHANYNATTRRYQ